MSIACCASRIKHGEQLNKRCTRRLRILKPVRHQPEHFGIPLGQPTGVCECIGTAFSNEPVESLEKFVGVAFPFNHPAELAIDRERPPLNIKSSAARKMIRISSSESCFMSVGSRVTGTRLTLQLIINCGIRPAENQSDFCGYFGCFDYLFIHNK